MEYYKNRLCLTFDELTGGDADSADALCRSIISFASYCKLTGSKKIQVARRGQRFVPALIDYESLPARIKVKVVAKYGDPHERSKDDSLRSRIEKDLKAEAWFETFSPSGKEYSTLERKYVNEYTANASILNAVIKMTADMTATIGRTGGKTKHVWPTISKLVNNLQGEFGAHLPNNAMSLKRKVAEYQRSGYIALVSGKFCNKAASKTKKEEQEALLVELLGNGRNLENATVARLYNEVARRCNWPTISERTVANYKDKHPETYAGRHGANAYYNNVAMQVKRQRPSTPMLLWSADGWDTELLYQETGRDSQGHKVTTYHKRPTVVVIIDAYSDYIVGYAIGKNENPALIRDAWRNAFWHVKELFGEMYKPFQIQTDNYAKKNLTEMYETSAAKAWTPAAVGNAKSKPIEPFFLQINRRQFRMYINSSGYCVKTKALMQPSANFINDNKRYFPDWDGVCEQVRHGIEKERAVKRDAFIAAFNSVPDQEKTVFKYDEFLRQYGERTDTPHQLHGHGIVLTMDGKQHSYDCFHPDFRNFGYKKFYLAYDEHDLREVVAIAAAGTERQPVESAIRFTLEEKYAQPMALADRKEGDYAQLRRVWDYNKQQAEDIIELRRKRSEVLQTFYDENNDKLLTDTTVKMLITDSRGQHKDVRNAATGRTEVQELQPAEKTREKVKIGDDAEDYVFDPRDTIRDI